MVEIDFKHAKLPKEAVKFIATFLRFEFALKEEGLGAKESKASVEWGRVAAKLGPEFYESVCKSGAAETIIRHPPKKQVCRDHRPDWERQDPPKDTQQLLEAVRRVRNNLLHGGKSGDPEFDPSDLSRSQTLISEAQWVVEQALFQMAGVRSYFEGRY